MSNVQFTSVIHDEGSQNLIVVIDGRLMPPVDDTHPNFNMIRSLCLLSFEGQQIDGEYLGSMFDVAQTVADKFERLSERVTVKNGVILLDGDPVHGTLQEQILQFLNAGEDFEPLVKFYEKLLTNPLGDVRDGLYDWITGQRANGNFTITPEGDILGYKSVLRTTPLWRTDKDEVFIPSRPGEGVVNGRDVGRSEFIEQVPGDVIEMPRSRVLNAPSQACGDGLHIGTYQYASTFYGGDTVMLVKFSPRDIVSLPDHNSTWKLRVCRYEVVGEVTEPLDAPVWSPKGQDEPVVLDLDSDEYAAEDEPTDLDLTTDDGDPQPGDTVRYEDDEGVVQFVRLSDGDLCVRWEDDYRSYVMPEDVKVVKRAPR